MLDTKDSSKDVSGRVQRLSLHHHRQGSLEAAVFLSYPYQASRSECSCWGLFGWNSSPPWYQRVGVRGQVELCNYDTQETG